MSEPTTKADLNEALRNLRRECIVDDRLAEHLWALESLIADLPSCEQAHEATEAMVRAGVEGVSSMVIATYDGELVPEAAAAIYAAMERSRVADAQPAVERMIHPSEADPDCPHVAYQPHIDDADKLWDARGRWTREAPTEAGYYYGWHPRLGTKLFEVYDTGGMGYIDGGAVDDLENHRWWSRPFTLPPPPEE